MAKRPTIDRYDFYHRAVQDPDFDIALIRRVYRKWNRRAPTTLREDFAGTSLLSVRWVSTSRDAVAHAVELDSEPLAWCERQLLPSLSASARDRVVLHRANVLDVETPPADVICAFNFSYYIFKERQTLAAYFQRCRAALRHDGMLVLDCFGGSQYLEPHSVRYRRVGLSYHWEQESFDPISHSARFHIHFEPRGGRLLRRQFSYDWRLWSVPELREILREAGFNHVDVYWESSDARGDGSGIFRPVARGEACQSWVAYLVAR